jgi:hypothetical protein
MFRAPGCVSVRSDRPGRPVANVRTETNRQHGAIRCRAVRPAPMNADALRCMHTHPVRRMDIHARRRMVMLERPFDERTFEREEEDRKNPGGSPTPPPPL